VLRLVLGHNQHATHCVLGLFPRVQRPGCKVNHSSVTYAKNMNKWNNTSAPPISLHDAYRENFLLLRSAFFRDVTKRRVVILCRRFGTTYPSQMGPTGCRATSVHDYHSTLRNTPEERRSHQHGGGNLKAFYFSSRVMK
jgi:hypothetical protein